jgi:hypothetical protein
MSQRQLGHGEAASIDRYRVADVAVAEDRCGVGDGERPAATAAVCSVQLRDCRYGAEVFDLLERRVLERWRVPCTGGRKRVRGR